MSTARSSSRASSASSLESPPLDASRTNSSRDAFSARSFLTTSYCSAMGSIRLSSLFASTTRSISTPWREMSAINSSRRRSAASPLSSKASVEDVEDEYDLVPAIARSSVDPTRTSRASRNFGAIICIPMGKPLALERPAGMDIAGKPASDAGTVMTSAAYVCAGLSASTSESFGAVDTLDGVSNTSTPPPSPPNTFVKSSDTNLRTFCAFSKYSAARALLRANAPTVTRRRTSSPKPKLRAFAMAL
mmetsp:Transcript_1508/g.6044  ORF Transcript_1508/g.6044 Transcript_1508/m.6044 type:complete len:247 (+) Transcript_1508:857-1597(+)